MEKANKEKPLKYFFETIKKEDAKRIKAISESGVNNLPKPNICETKRIGNTEKYIKKFLLIKYKLAKRVIKITEALEIIFIAIYSSTFKKSETNLIDNTYPDLVEYAGK